MKQVLILGGSGGIGRACAAEFRKSSSYRISEVNRKVGDLRSLEFRKSLAEKESPQVVIAAFGSYPTEQTTFVEAIEEFTLSIIDLYEKFETRGTMEHFVVVSSLSANVSSLPHVFMNSATHKYIIAKRLLSDFFRQTQLHMKSKSKIILLEPGYVRTRFASIEDRAKEMRDDDFLTRTALDLIEPETIARAIYDAVANSAQPPTSLTFFNRQKPL